MFDTSTLVLTYTPPDTQISYNLILTVQDNKNDPVEYDITMTVNLKPRIKAGLPDLSGTFIALTESFFELQNDIFSDEDDPLIYNLEVENQNDVYGCGQDYCDAPSWVVLEDPATTGTGFNISGTFATYQHVTLDLVLKAYDSDGLSNFVPVELSVQGKFDLSN